LLALGLGILLAGCGNDSDQSSPAPAFSSPRGIALDSANNRTLMVDSIPPSQATVVTVNSSTGDHATLSDNATGIGPDFLFPRGIALDSANNRALVVDSIPPLLNAVVAVDFSTGERTILSDSVTGMGPNFLSPRGIALDSANNRALVVDASLAAGVAVDLSPGDRTILSESVTGTGPPFLAQQGIALDRANNRAL
jgi:DNA-binding beta-propeller fold protein YncE